MTLAEKIAAIRAHFETGENPKYARLLVDKDGKIVVDTNGNPLIQREVAVAVKDVNETDYTITHLISTPRIDYVGDVMNPFGCNDAILRKGKSVFWNHSWGEPDSLPIGKNLWIKKTKEGVLALTKYAVEESDFAAQIFRLVKGGYINSYSIGFFPSEWNLMSLADLKTLISAQPQSRQFDIPNATEYASADQVWYHSKWDCYEYSNVGVPMNQDAVKKSLRKALTDGVITSDFGKAYFGSIAEPDAVSVPPSVETISVATQEDVKALREEFAGLSSRIAGLSGMVEQLGALIVPPDEIKTVAEPEVTLEPTPEPEAPAEETIVEPAPVESVETEGTPSAVVELDIRSMLTRAATGAVSRAIGKGKE